MCSSPSSPGPGLASLDSAASTPPCSCLSSPGTSSEKQHNPDLSILHIEDFLLFPPLQILQREVGGRQEGRDTGLNYILIS